MFRLMEPSSGDTLTNLILLNYAFYMDPYIVFVTVCYNNLKKYSMLFSLLLITVTCTDCILYCFKDVLNKYLNLLKVLKH
jgi:hypothetical protein